MDSCCDVAESLLLATCRQRFVHWCNRAVDRVCTTSGRPVDALNATSLLLPPVNGVALL